MFAYFSPTTLTEMKKKHQQNIGQKKKMKKRTFSEAMRSLALI